MRLLQPSLCMKVYNIGAHFCNQGDIQWHMDRYSHSIPPCTLFPASNWSRVWSLVQQYWRCIWTPARLTSHSKIMKWILTWSHLCCYNSSHSSGNSFHQMLEHCWGDLPPFSHRCISEVGRWCWVLRPGSQSAFQFIPKVRLGWGQGSVQTSQVLPHKSWQTISVWTSLCARGHCHTETGKSLPKTVATSWKHRII